MGWGSESECVSGIVSEETRYVCVCVFVCVCVYVCVVCLPRCVHRDSHSVVCAPVCRTLLTWHARP